MTGCYSRLKAWLELEKNNDLLETDLTSWQQTYSWVWNVEPSRGRFALWDRGLNRAEHISARHDQLAFLSRSDLPPSPNAFKIFVRWIQTRLFYACYAISFTTMAAGPVSIHFVCGETRRPAGNCFATPVLVGRDATAAIVVNEMRETAVSQEPLCNISKRLDWSNGEKVEEKCLLKESSTGSHFILSLSLSLSLSLFLILFILNQRFDELIWFILKAVELPHGESNTAVRVPNPNHQPWRRMYLSWQVRRGLFLQS